MNACAEFLTFYQIKMNRLWKHKDVYKKAKRVAAEYVSYL